MGDTASRQPDVEAFIKRWTDSTGGAERANYALFFVELCELIGVGRPGARTLLLCAITLRYRCRFQFRYNNRWNPDIFGAAIKGC